MSHRCARPGRRFRVVLVAALLLAVALPAQATTTEVGSHVVQQFRIHRASGSTTAVLGVEDTAGGLGMYGYVSGGRFWVTDGEVDGQARAPIEVSVIGHGWHRVDLLLHGATYELHFDQTIVVTGRTFAPMTAGRPLEDPTGLLPLRPERVDFAWQRVDNDDMAHDTSFARSLASSGWERVVSPASLTTPTVEVEDMQGHRDRGRLSVISPPLDGVAYVRAPAPEGPYVAHATGYARDPMVPPASQSVLAGLHGDALNPEVAWSVSFDKVPGIAEWALFYEDDAQRVQVSPAYDLYPWLPVEATVHAGAIHLRVSGESAGTFHPVDLGDVTHIGIGDVTAAFMDRPRARGSAYYDDAAVYRLP